MTLADGSPPPTFSARHPRLTKYVIIAMSGALVVLVDQWTKPEPPPFVPLPFQFRAEGSHIHAQGCFVGEEVLAPINQQEIEVDVAAGTVDLEEIAAIKSKDTANWLYRAKRRYQIISDDGDILTATSREALPYATLYTLQVSRRSRTVSAIERTAFGATALAELKDGKQVYRQFRLSRRSWGPPDAWSWLPL